MAAEAVRTNCSAHQTTECEGVVGARSLTQRPINYRPGQMDKFRRNSFVLRASVAATFLTVAAVLATGLFGNRQQVGEPHTFALKPAVIRAFESKKGQPILMVSYLHNGMRGQIEFNVPDVPHSYSSLVVPSWSRSCTWRVGREVRVAHAGGSPFVVLEEETGQGSQVASQRTWRLCYARLYFDLTPVKSGMQSMELKYALGTTLGLISEERTPVPVWIRGDAETVLSLYAEPAPMLDAAVQRQQPLLAESVKAIRDLRFRLRSQVILARVVPFRFNWPERPVGGGWPYFVVTIWNDGPSNRPVKLVDFFSDVRW